MRELQHIERFLDLDLPYDTKIELLERGIELGIQEADRVQDASLDLLVNSAELLGRLKQLNGVPVEREIYDPMHKPVTYLLGLPGSFDERALCVEVLSEIAEERSRVLLASAADLLGRYKAKRA